MSGGDRHDDDPPTDDWLDPVTAAAQDLPLPEPPEGLTQSLKDLFQSQTAVQWSEAQLIRDSRADRTPVGARGSTDASVWTATYCAPTADVVLDGVVEADGSMTTAGQIFPLDDGSSAFRISVDGPMAVSAYTDDLGQFELGRLVAGTYKFEANNDRHGMRLTFEVDNRDSAGGP